MPVFARSGAAGITAYVAVFPVLADAWCAAGWFSFPGRDANRWISAG